MGAVLPPLPLQDTFPLCSGCLLQLRVAPWSSVSLKHPSSGSAGKVDGYLDECRLSSQSLH